MSVIKADDESEVSSSIDTRVVLSPIPISRLGSKQILRKMTNKETTNQLDLHRSRKTIQRKVTDVSPQNSSSVNKRNNSDTFNKRKYLNY